MRLLVSVRGAFTPRGDVCGLRPAHPPTQVTNKTTPAGAPLGVAAKETGDTDYARRLAQAHAAVVSDFVKRGHVAAMEAHAPPKRG